MLDFSIRKIIFYSLLIASFNSGYAQGLDPILLNPESKSKAFIYNFQGSFDFSGLNNFTDNLNYSSKVIFNKRRDKVFQFPISLYIGQLKTSTENVENSKQQIVNENFGLGLGFYPEIKIVPYKNKGYLTLNSGLSWRFNSFQTSQDTIKFLNSGRVSISLEIGFNLFKEFSNNRPVSLNLTPIRSIFQPDDYIDLYKLAQSGFNALELSSNIPIGKGGFSIVGKSIILDLKISYIGLGLMFSGSL